MNSQSTARVSWTLLVTLCIWVASGEGLSLDGQVGSQRRSALGAAQQSTCRFFLLDVVGQADATEEAADAKTSDPSPGALALSLDTRSKRSWTWSGARGYFLPLPRAPGL